MQRELWGFFSDGLIKATGKDEKLRVEIFCQCEGVGEGRMFGLKRMQRRRRRERVEAVMTGGETRHGGRRKVKLKKTKNNYFTYSTSFK